jgi:hypothetical protein
MTLRFAVSGMIAFASDGPAGRWMLLSEGWIGAVPHPANNKLMALR